MADEATVLQNCALFAGTRPEEFSAMLNCLQARRQTFEKGEFLFHAGDPVARMGVVLAGALHLADEDFWGNRNLLAQVEPGELFGEAYACAGGLPAQISAVAAQETLVLFLSAGRIFSPCESGCAFHRRLADNLLEILARKNLLLTEKIRHVTRRTTREKLLAYLSAQARAAGSECFTIPFTRQQLADYLSVERSAMCTELGHLQTDGLLVCKGRSFRLM